MHILINSFMRTEFVSVKCDVHCAWTGPYPRYRLYVNDELFAERTWIWRDVYLEENLQIQAPYGKYQVQIQALNPEFASFEIKNMRVDHGPAVIGRDKMIRVYDPRIDDENK
jgi:hypothetical protein